MGHKVVWRFPWRLFCAEFVGTAMLVLAGLSLVILLFGTGSPFGSIVPSITVRRVISGFLFGAIGGVIALSPVGRESGAHVNPVVTLAFWLAGRLDSKVAGAYVVAQLGGAIVGCAPLLIWGSMGRSISFGATVPGDGYSTSAVMLGEAITTFGLISGLCVFLSFRKLRKYTPAMIPFLYAVMVPIEAPISGTSTNPARSLGPAIIAGEWRGWWIYWIAPVVGAFVALASCSRLAKRIEVAKLYYFDTDHSGVIHKLTRRAPAQNRT
jgi:aquaporin Z